MRYDKQIFFVKEGARERLPNGQWIETEPVKTEAWANVSDTGTQRMTLVYGAYKQGAKTVRIRNHYEEPFDYIEIEDGKYRMDTSLKFRHDMSFDVSEVQ